MGERRSSETTGYICIFKTDYALIFTLKVNGKMNGRERERDRYRGRER